MSEGDNVLAIDQGGQSTRAIVFDRRGRSLRTGRAALSTHRPADGRVEHDPQALLASVRTAIDRGTAGQRDIAAAGLATQRSSIVCWDRLTGQPLSPVISWQDRRAADLLEALAPAPRTVQRITGLMRSPHYGASKLRWCLDNLPEAIAAKAAGTLAIGPLSSFIVFHLVEDRPFVVDPANASRTLLWDVNTGDWSETLLQAFGIARELLPRCVTTRYDYGPIAGLGVPLDVCTGDQNAAIFAGGPVAAATGYVNIGTGAFVLAPANDAPPETRLLRSVLWRDATTLTYALEGTVNGAGSALAARGAERSETEKAAAAIGASGVPLFLNGVSGLGSPWWRDRFVSRFLGEADESGRLTAVLESILFMLQVNIEEITRVLVLRDLVVSGGLAGHDGLCQGLADLSGLTVWRPAAAEGTARGLAFLTADRPAGWEGGRRACFAPDARRNRLASRLEAWRRAMEIALAGDA